MLTILGRCIDGKRFSAGKRCMWIRISGRQIDDFEMVSSGTVTGWGGWWSGQKWHRLWSLLAVSVGRRCTCFFLPRYGYTHNQLHAASYSCCFQSYEWFWNYASWVVFLVDALAALRWTNWCLRSCCVPISNIFDEAPANQLDLDPLGPGWSGCVSMICWCGIDEEDDNEKKWEVLRII